MAIGPRLDLRLGQALVMTPQLRQAIQLLQFSNLEVQAWIEQELERNPLLERDDRPTDEAPPAAPAEELPPLGDAREAVAAADEAPLDADFANVYDPGGAADGGSAAGAGGRGGRTDFDGEGRDVEEFAVERRSLREHLAEQLRLSIADPTDRLIGACLIAGLDPAGRLALDLDALAGSLGCARLRIEAVLARMQRFDPPGVFARSLRECLEIQLREKNRYDPAMAVLLDHLDLLAKRDMRRLMALCGVDAEDLADMIAELKRLDPKPGAAFDAEPATTVVPDVLMRRAEDGGWIVELNPETLPRVLANGAYYARVAAGAKSREERVFIAEHWANATWLVKSLAQRASTILKVASEIVRQQDAFFRHGITHLKPLILRDIATAVELHESTVSRVTANKYIATPRGTLELKFFFTTAIAGTGGESHSAETVRYRIRELIAAEDPEAVLSDDQIVAILRREGVDIARRTVAKYREGLGIPSSVQRRREKAVPA
ncbi:RNA polymerase factor sigma-54 [Elioraea sp. Yellowstone]|jgi:RNA polymerase sigma-54 factor|uniref:RNA polymerase factor sigma-54 n=1 Tax=Elioraea sp. Yellowstone TaxID=2592070 RepID=UPI00114FD953|nr:RNA polymerase factor sigma-54 [Elioraea sp. Yellowstone]TQF76588.1 RNA polymerase factor sigma-54 [Elioraea sp. Yellowstone]